MDRKVRGGSTPLRRIRASKHWQWVTGDRPNPAADSLVAARRRGVPCSRRSNRRETSGSAPAPRATCLLLRQSRVRGRLGFGDSRQRQRSHDQDEGLILALVANPLPSGAAERMLTVGGIIADPGRTRRYFHRVDTSTRTQLLAAACRPPGDRSRPRVCLARKFTLRSPAEAAPRYRGLSRGLSLTSGIAIVPRSTVYATGCTAAVTGIEKSARPSPFRGPRAGQKRSTGGAIAGELPSKPPATASGPALPAPMTSPSSAAQGVVFVCVRAAPLEAPPAAELSRLAGMRTQRSLPSSPPGPVVVRDWTVDRASDRLACTTGLARDVPRRTGLNTRSDSSDVAALAGGEPALTARLRSSEDPERCPPKLGPAASCIHLLARVAKAPSRDRPLSAPRRSDRPYSAASVPSRPRRTKLFDPRTEPTATGSGWRPLPARAMGPQPRAVSRRKPTRPSRRYPCTRPECDSVLICSHRTERQADAELVEDLLDGERSFDGHGRVGAQHPRRTRRRR